MSVSDTDFSFPLPFSLPCATLPSPPWDANACHALAPTSGEVRRLCEKPYSPV